MTDIISAQENVCLALILEGIGEDWGNSYVCEEDTSLHAVVLNKVVIVGFFKTIY